MAELYLGFEDQRPEYASGGKPRTAVRVPNPWDAPPWNGSKAAYLRDQVSSGANFSHLLSDPEFAAEYERVKGERDVRHTAQQNSPEYRAMVERDQKRREQQQHDALAAQQARNGGFWGDLARAGLGMAAAPVYLARSAPGLKWIADHSPAGLAADAYQAAGDAIIPGGSGMTRNQGGVITRELARAGFEGGGTNSQAAAGPSFGSPYDRTVPGLGGGGAAGMPAGAGLGTEVNLDPAGIWQRALDQTGSGSAQVGQSLEDLGNAFDERAPDATALAAARQAREADIMARIDALGVDPGEFADRALAAELARASTVAGGGAAQRGAAFQSMLSMPAIQAEAADQARAAEVEQARLAADVGTAMSEQELGEYNSNLNAATQLFGYSAQLEGLGAQLDQADRELLGAVARDIADLSFRYAELDETARNNQIRAELEKYGIDTQLAGILAQLEPGQAGFQGDAMDYLISIGLAIAPLLMPKGAR